MFIILFPLFFLYSFPHCFCRSAELWSRSSSLKSLSTGPDTASLHFVSSSWSTYLLSLCPPSATSLASSVCFNKNDGQSVLLIVSSVVCVFAHCVWTHFFSVHLQEPHLPRASSSSYLESSMSVLFLKNRSLYCPDPRFRYQSVPSAFKSIRKLWSNLHVRVFSTCCWHRCCFLFLRVCRLPVLLH